VGLFCGSFIMSGKPSVALPTDRHASIARVLWGIRLLAIVAGGVAAYLAWQSWVGRGPAGCGEGSACDDVLTSRWSTWLGIPVSAMAAAVYLAVLVASFGAPLFRWRALAVLATVAAGAAIWFVALQVGPMHQFCPYCMAVHACGLLLAGLVAVGWRMLDERPARAGRLVAVGLLGPAMLIGGQLLVPGQRTLLTFGGSGGGRGATTSTATRGTLPRFWVNGTPIELDPHDLPVLGSPDAPYPLAVMTDYTCPHCREMHKLLGHVRDRYGAQVALVILPVPMNAQCNPRIKVTQPRHEYACEVSRLALAVWRRDPKAFVDRMDPWLFDSTLARTPAEVRSEAALLIGADRLRRAEADPWIEQTIRRSVGLYAQANGGLIPKLLLPKDVPPGNVKTEQELFQMLERELGLKPVAARDRAKER
jgi:uncharacterized membrane protein